MEDAGEEVPQHQEAEDLRSSAQEGFEQVFGSGDQQCSSEEDEEGPTPVAVLIMADELEAMLQAAFEGNDPSTIMLEIYANSDPATREDWMELTGDDADQDEE